MRCSSTCLAALFSRKRWSQVWPPGDCFRNSCSLACCRHHIPGLSLDVAYVANFIYGGMLEWFLHCFVSISNCPTNLPDVARIERKNFPDLVPVSEKDTNYSAWPLNVGRWDNFPTSYTAQNAMVPSTQANRRPFQAFGSEAGL